MWRGERGAAHPGVAAAQVEQGVVRGVGRVAAVQAAHVLKVRLPQRACRQADLSAPM